MNAVGDSTKPACAEALDMKRRPSDKERHAELLLLQFFEVEVAVGTANSAAKLGNLRRKTSEVDSECLKKMDWLSLLPRDVTGK